MPSEKSEFLFMGINRIAYWAYFSSTIPCVRRTRTINIIRLQQKHKQEVLYQKSHEK